MARRLPFSLAAILALAAALRLVGIEYGLPFGGLLNPDEPNIVRRAFGFVHGAGLDPHWFDYPTLVLYVLSPFQAWQAEPSYLAARVVVAVFGIGAVAAAWWLGRTAYGQTAGLVAAAAVAVETTGVAYSHMAVTDVPMTALVAVSLALAVGGRLEWAGVAAGLAAGAKYPAVILLAPLLVAGWRRWRRLAAALALGVGAFLATSPYLLVHPHQAWDDATRVQRLAREGWLGFEHDSFALFAFTGKLWDGLGPALVVAVLGLVLALRRRSRADLILAAFVLVYFADLLTLRAHFDRYVLPLVPALAALAGRQRFLAPATLGLLVVPLVWAIGDDVRLTRTDTRAVAESWIVAHVPPGSRVAAESSTPPLDRYRVVGLALPGPGRPFDPDRDLARLRAEGVEYALVTGAVADRVLAARDRYPREAGFYDDLQARAKRVYHVDPGHGLAGPWVSLYRL
ncbi:MAG TPA: glycosyltransferase 87 family protein [Gaiellaceae bacterium]|nr:glycosyltransferase 87 family protein [Gaiellaceae bacterium]